MLVILLYLRYRYLLKYKESIYPPSIFTQCNVQLKLGRNLGQVCIEFCVIILYLQVSTINVVFLLLFSLTTELELCTVIVRLEAEVRWDKFLCLKLKLMISLIIVTMIILLTLSLSPPSSSPSSFLLLLLLLLPSSSSLSLPLPSCPWCPTLTLPSCKVQQN